MCFHLPREIILYFFGDFDMILLWFCYGFLMVDFMFFLPVLKTVMISIWFCYGPGVLHFFSYEICYGWSYLFCKKNHLVIFLDISEWKKQ